VKTPYVPPRRAFGRDITRRPGSALLAKRTFICNGCGDWSYGAKRPGQCRICGRLDYQDFDSKDEATRWAQLDMLQKRGKISDLRRNTRYNLYAYGPEGQPVKVAVYEDDFNYLRDGERVIEDVKGGRGIDRFAALKLQWMAGMGRIVTVVNVK